MAGTIGLADNAATEPFIIVRGVSDDHVENEDARWHDIECHAAAPSSMAQSPCSGPVPSAMPVRGGIRDDHDLEGSHT